MAAGHTYSNLEKTSRLVWGINIDYVNLIKHEQLVFMKEKGLTCE